MTEGYNEDTGSCVFKCLNKRVRSRGKAFKGGFTGGRFIDKTILPSVKLSRTFNDPSGGEMDLFIVCSAHEDDRERHCAKEHPGLSEKGRTEAEMLGLRFAGTVLDTILCGPLTTQIETACRIAVHQPKKEIVIIPDLIEVGFYGKMPEADLINDVHDGIRITCAGPETTGGPDEFSRRESVDVQERTIRANRVAKYLRNSYPGSEKVLAVTSPIFCGADLIPAVMGAYPSEARFKMAFAADYASVCEICLSEFGERQYCRSINDMTHLKSL